MVKIPSLSQFFIKSDYWSKILCCLSLVFICFGILGNIGSLEVRAEDKIEYLTISNTSSIIPLITPGTEYQGGIAVIVNGSFRGLVGCQNTGIFSKENNNSGLDNNAACAGTVITQSGRIVNTGSVIDKNAKMEFIYKQDEPDNLKIFAIPDYKIYRNAGFSGTSADADIIIFNTKSGNYTSGKAREFFADPTKPKKEEIEAVIKTRSNVLNLTGASVLGTKVNSGTVSVLDEAKSKEAEISKKANATCKAILDATNKVIYECIDKDGKKVGLDGKPLAEGNGGFTIDSSGNQAGLINQAVVDNSKKLATNTEAKTTNQTTENKSAGDLAGDGLLKALGGIVNILLLIISVFFLILAYIAGWIGMTVLWLLGWVFLIILRINPAGVNFINVAADPWRIVVGMANMLVLSTFIFVGFGYILDIKNLKVKLEEFFLNIVIFTLVLNFTLLGSAAVVNVTQGLGEVMVGSYAISEPDPAKANFALINGLIEGISRASVIRCGNISFGGTESNPATKPVPAGSGTADTAPPNASDKADPGGCQYGLDGIFGQVAKVGGAVATAPIQALGANLQVNGKNGNLITITTMELVFCFIVFFAITIFWKAVYLVLGRTIGLWILIVLSPLALAAYISPIQALKKYGGQWLDHFWKWCLFYPAFIFGLILVNVMSRSFADAAKAGTDTLASNTAGIQTNAAFGEIAGGEFTSVLIFAVLGIVPIVIFAALVDWFAKSFEAIAKAAMGAVKQGWGLVKGGSGAIGATMGFAGVKTGKLGDWAEKKVPMLKNWTANTRAKAATRATRIESEITAQQTIADDTTQSAAIRRAAAQKVNQLEKDKAKELDISQNFKAGLGLNQLGKGLSGTGSVISAAPLVAESVVREAKYELWDKNANNVKANQQANLNDIKRKNELYWRERADTDDKIRALDANPNTRYFLGQGKNQINSMKADSPNHYNELIKAAKEQDFRNSLGLDKAEIKDQKAAETDVKNMISNYGDNIDELIKDGRLQDLLRYVEMSKTNKIIQNALLNNPLGSSLVRQSRRYIAQMANGPVLSNWLNEEQPKTIEDADDRKEAGEEIGRNFKANPTSYKFPDGIDDDDVKEGIAKIIGPEEFYKRFGNKPYTAQALGAAGNTVNIKGRDTSSPYASITTNRTEEKIMQGIRNTVEDSGYRGQVAKEIHDKLEQNPGATGAQIDTIVDTVVAKSHKDEFGTVEMGRDQASLDRGVSEIVSKTVGDLKDQSKIAKRIASKNLEIASLLSSSNPTEQARGEKLLKKGVVEAFYTASAAQDTLYGGFKNLGLKFNEAKSAGDQASAPYTYASDQLDMLVGAANGDAEKLKQIINQDDGGNARNALGAAKIASYVTKSKNTGMAISKNLGIKQTAFVGEEPGPAAVLQKDMLLAIAQTSQKGIDSSGNFVDSSAIDAFNRANLARNGGNNIIDTNVLAQSIVSHGEDWLNEIKIEAEVNPGTVIKSTQQELENNGLEVVQGYMIDVNKQDDKFVANSNIKPKTLVPGNTVTVPTPQQQWQNAIQALRTNLPAELRANGVRGIDNDGYLLDAAGNRVDNSGAALDLNNPFVNTPFVLPPRP